ncbi:MAG: hypothetical protein Q9163_004831 [Psora crenata]
MTVTVDQDFRSATNLLLDHGIPLIVWGDQVLKSHGYPVVTSVYDFIIPDSQLDHASTILRNAGFPTVEPNLALKCAGIFGKAGYLHVSVYDRKRWPIRLHLLPESLVHLSIHDTESVPSPFDQTRTLYRPKLPEHCVSLLRCLEDYPLRSRDRARPLCYLTVLFAVGVFKEQQFDKLWIPEEELEPEAEFQARRFAAVREIQSWKLAEKDESYRSKLVDLLFSNSSDCSVRP